MYISYARGILLLWLKFIVSKLKTKASRMIEMTANVVFDSKNDAEDAVSSFHSIL